MNVVVTGGTKGIGRAIVELFLDKGRNLATCSRNNEELISLKNAWQTEYPNQKILIKEADLQSKNETLDFARYLLSEWNQIDILVNNAGIFIPGQVHKEESGILEKSIETNLYSPYHLTRAILPNMLKRKKGHIFNICSIASLFAYPNGGSYSISKFALLGFSKVLREELKDKGIKVTSVIPGATWSASWSGLDEPEHRLMQAKDVALAVWNATIMSPSAVVEEIILRPQLGDLK